MAPVIPEEIDVGDGKAFLFTFNAADILFSLGQRDIALVSWLFFRVE